MGSHRHRNLATLKHGFTTRVNLAVVDSNLATIKHGFTRIYLGVVDTGILLL